MRSSWAFTERFASVPLPKAEQDKPTENILKQFRSPISTENLFKAIGATTLGFLFLKETPFQMILASYKQSLALRPLRTKVLTGSTLSLLGDCLAQRREAKGSYDAQRGLSFAAFDSCYRIFQHIAIPVIVRLGKGDFLALLLSLIPFCNPRQDVVPFFAAMERTLIYQFALIPLFYYPVFFTFTGIMQGLSVAQTVARAKSCFFLCWKNNLIFWIPIQLVMFGLVDEKWQIPFVCLMGIIWSSILSVTAGKARLKDPP